MSDWILIGVSPNLANWLTPVWLLGVGATAGLVLLLLLWGICAALSKIPLFGTLAESPRQRNIAAGAVAAVLVILAAPPILIVGLKGWYAAGWTAAISGCLFALLWIVLLAVLVAFSAVTLVGRRTVAEIPMAVTEGVLLWILVLLVVVGSLAGAATFVVKEPVAMLGSLVRLPYTGTTTRTYAIAAPRGQAEEIDFSRIEEQAIPVSFRGDELKSLEFRSNEPLEVSAQSFATLDPETAQTIKTPAGAPLVWYKGERGAGMFPPERVSTLYVRNLGQGEAKLDLTVVTAPPYPEVKTIPITALSVIALFLLYVLQRSLAPRLSAIALSTCKSEIAQPMFIILLVVGAVALAVFVIVPYHTFGEDIKMLKDSGLTLILVFAIFQAIWAASKSISEEIEGRTALTVLSKPIGRRAFILGKYLGIVWTIALMFLVLGAVFLIVVAYKPIYDAYERGGTGATWQECHREMILIVPGLVLAFMEALVLAALSVAFSTRLPMMANFLTCAAIYVLGHLTPLMVQSSLNRFEIVTFVARLIATIFPVLDHFNIQAAVAGGADVPLQYLGWSLLYCLIYGTIAMLLALVMFEDRDLA